jgi:heme exporter protein C
MEANSFVQKVVNAKKIHVVYRVIAIVFLVYAFTWGLIGPVPAKPNLEETIRNLYYHVPMWFGLVLLAFCSFMFSVFFLLKGENEADQLAESFALTSTVFGVLGFATGMLWAQYTWGNWWAGDVKQICALASILVYGAYFVLRNAIAEQQQRARVAAVYNILAFFSLIPLLFIIPRNAEFSLHPGGQGSGAVGNPAFNKYDLDNRMRIVFWPAIIGWFSLGLWITHQYFRIKVLEIKKMLS